MVAPPPKPTIYGEWERRSDPYRGMRMWLREDEPNGSVTRPSTVDASATNKAQLECQRSLWKAGDVLVRDLHGDSATIVVRDWGLTSGVCRHQDTPSSARLSLRDDDTLTIAVTRGKATVTQEWTRVR